MNFNYYRPIDDDDNWYDEYSDQGFDAAFDAHVERTFDPDDQYGDLK